MTTFIDRVFMRAGATPDTYDGNQTITLNATARKIHALLVSNSESIHTTDEGVGISVRMTSPNWTGNLDFQAGWISPSGPATNNAVKIVPVSLVQLDLDVKPNTTVTFNITSIAGATQTGTSDTTIGLIYSDGSVGPNWEMKFPDCLPAKGGVVERTAVTATTETALDTMVIPAHAKALIGYKAILTCDGAVTASEEGTGFVRLQLDLSGQGATNLPLSSLQPNLGTEVEGSAAQIFPYIPIWIPLEGRELTARGFANLASAVTTSGTVIFGLIWM